MTMFLTNLPELHPQLPGLALAWHSFCPAFLAVLLTALIPARPLSLRRGLARLSVFGNMAMLSVLRLSDGAGILLGVKTMASPIRFTSVGPGSALWFRSTAPWGRALAAAPGAEPPRCLAVG
jgi:hypothetical protein